LLKNTGTIHGSSKMTREISLMQSNLPGASDACRLLQNMVNQEGVCASRKVNKPLILYGAGDLGRMAKEFFGKLGIPFLYVVDANPDRYIGSDAWKNISILRPEDVSPEHRAECLLAICIVTASYAGISDPLIKQGWQDIVPFYDIAEAYKDRYPLGNGWFTRVLTPQDVEEMKYVLNYWADDISRAHHLQFISWHALRKELGFDGAPVTTNDRFFIPQIISSLHEKEIFLDGGAHHGEVSLRFIDIVHHKFAKIYAIEPDKHNYNILRAKLCEKNSPVSQNIHTIECALGKRAGSARFLHGLGYASKFSPMAQESVMVRTINEMDIPVTFIKLHLEGSEYDALLGAIAAINKYRPLIAVTTYHNRDGLWRTPDLLMKRLTGYVFLLRIHSWMGTGSVLYAIPQERYEH
jgi:FkbM family methyltransferase